MTNSENMPEMKLPLGVGQMVSDTFSIFFKRFFVFFGLAFAIYFFFNVLTHLIAGEALFNIEAVATGFDSDLLWALVIQQIVMIFIYSVVMATLVLVALDTKLGNPIRIGTYIKTAMVCLPAILVLQILYFIAVVFGLTLLIIPGLYLMAMWAVFVPAIVVERVGFRGLGRSSALTKNYRWQILGFVLIYLIIVVVISVIFQFLSGIGIAASQTPPSVWLVILSQPLAGAISSAIYAIAAAVLFARLKEIKEGLGMGELVEIFD